MESNDKDKFGGIILPSRSLSLNTDDYPQVINDTSLPPHFLEKERLLQERVIGQSRAVRKMVRAFRNLEAGLTGKRPQCILCAGPSGVGKTYLPKQGALVFIGPTVDGIDPYVLIECAKMKEGHEISYLTGAPPGYVGYNAPSPLEKVGKYSNLSRQEAEKYLADQMEQTVAWLHRYKAKIQRLAEKDYPEQETMLYEEVNIMLRKVRKELEDGMKPFLKPSPCVVIFDEIDRASTALQEVLFNALEEGYISLNNGKIVDFSTSLIVFTTNIGTAVIMSEHFEKNKIGFDLASHNSDSYERTDREIYHSTIREIEDSKKENFYQPLLGRIGGRRNIVVFQPLRYEHYRQILRLMLQEEVFGILANNNSGKGYVYVASTPQLEDFLVYKGVDIIYGARPLRSVIDKYVNDALAIRILNQGILSGDMVLLDVEFARPEGASFKEKGDAQIVVRRMERPAGGEYYPFGSIPIKKPKVDIAAMDDFIKKFFDKYPKKHISEKIGSLGGKKPEEDIPPKKDPSKN